MKFFPFFSRLPAVLTYLFGLFAIIAGLYALVVGLRLVPPEQLSIAAGAKGSAYYQFAQQYQTMLAEDDIQLEIIETAGSKDNSELMDDSYSGVDIAIIQGGIATKNVNLNALAAIFPEPVLIFARVDAKLEGNPFTWAGKRVALGAEGSGTRAVVKQLEALTHAPILSTQVTNPYNLMGGKAAANALLEGRLDLAFFVAPLTASYLQALLDSPSIELLPIDHSRALASQIQEAHHVDLLSGALRYQPSYPVEPVPLVTMVAKLVARDDLHPALVNRLMHAVKEIHGKRVTLVMSEPFPNTSLLDMPADVYASKLLREGFNPMEKMLPYWIVAQINRFALLLLPIIFLMLPLFKILPALLAWRMQSRVYRYYDRLHEIDMLLSVSNASEKDDNDRKKLTLELNDIEASLRSESLPLKYRESAYTVVQHLNLVRSRL
ncbi:MAG: TRAP-type uncharacterized transport system substrate-binding protein [Oleiphilaceae bacterium]|jgi:TRAP-type uncharacterized transport system substrate-binding protein